MDAFVTIFGLFAAACLPVVVLGSVVSARKGGSIAAYWRSVPWLVVPGIVYWVLERERLAQAVGHSKTLANLAVEPLGLGPVCGIVFVSVSGRGVSAKWAGFIATLALAVAVYLAVGALPE